MKNSWGFFIAGFTLSIAALLVYRETFAEVEVSKEASGLKAPVPDYSQLEGSIAAREKLLEKRTQELKEIEEALSKERAALEERIVNLEKTRDEVKKYQEENAKLSDAIFARLVKTYESMDPKKAAGVISVMEDKLAVELLLTMKEKKIAALLQVMDPARAMQLSTLVSDRRPAGQAVPSGRPAQK